MSEISERSTPLSGPLSVTPLYAAPGDEIVWWDGRSWNELAGGTSAGPINVTGDVLGTGTSSIPTTVLGLQGRSVSSTAPLDGQVLGWSSAGGGHWHPVPAAVVTGGGSPPGGATGTIQINAGSGNFGGITISGDATLNYSTGALSLAPMTGLTAGFYQGITFDAAGRATAAVNMNYAPLASPAFTGVPSADTAPPGTNSRQLATTAYVDSLYSPGTYIDANSTSVTLSDGVSVNLTSLSLAAGDWIINGSVYFATGTALNYNFMVGANTTSATLPGIPYYTQLSPAGALAGGAWTLNIPERKFTFTVPTTVYLVVRAGFGSGATVTAQGHIAAEQMQKLITGGGGGGGGSGGPITLSGDVTGSGTGGVVTLVTGLRGGPISTTPPADTYVLAWSASAGQWQPTAPPTGTGGVTGSGLTANRLVIGSGGSVISVTGSPGTTTTVLHGNASGPPSFGAVDLANDVTGNLSYTHLAGGSGATSSTYWRGDGTWATPTAVAAPGGAPGNVQYNNAGTSIGGSTGLTLSGSAVTGLNVGLDATGDLYYRASGGFTRLPIGSPSFLLQASAGGVPVWASVAVGGGTVASGGAAGQIALYTATNTVAAFTMGQDAAISPTGNVTIAPLAITTPKLADQAATYAKIQAVTASMLLGRGQGAGNGVAQEITIGTGLSMAGTTLAAIATGTVASSTVGQVPYYSAATTVTGNPTITSTTAGVLTLNGTPGTVPPSTPALGNTLLVLAGTDVGGPSGNVEIQAFVGAPNIVFKRANTSATSPSGVINTDILGSLQSRGRLSTGAWSNGTAFIQFISTDAWSGTVNGTKVIVSATPTGTSTPATEATFQSGVLVGPTTTVGVQTVGDVNCKRVLIDGVVQTFGGGTDSTATLSAATGAQGAGAMTAQFNIVTPVAAGQVVTLPAATVGAHCLVRNSGANALLIYPASGAQINTLGPNIAITVLTNSTAYFEASGTAQWFTVP